MDVFGRWRLSACCLLRRVRRSFVFLAARRDCIDRLSLLTDIFLSSQSFGPWEFRILVLVDGNGSGIGGFKGGHGLFQLLL